MRAGAQPRLNEDSYSLIGSSTTRDLENVLSVIDSNSSIGANLLGAVCTSIPSASASASDTSVDDFLNDLDAALMPSPTSDDIRETFLVAAHTAINSTAAALVTASPPPKALLSRSNCGSMQQRMFPTVGSPMSPSASISENHDGCSVVTRAGKSSSFESRCHSSLPCTKNTDGLATKWHTIAIANGNETRSSIPQSTQSAITENTAIGQVNKTVKCSRVTLCGAASTRGVKSSVFSKRYL